MSCNGFLLIDKPEGPSSFAAVKRARKVFKTKKAGHCGTLDPLASGLLIVAVGKGTRLIPDLLIEPKVYEFGIQFGKTTSTLDREGEILAEGGRLPSADEIKDVLPEFKGTISQTPPKFSAIKINGVPAYKLARKEKEFEIKSREINIFELSLLDYDIESGVADMRVECSGGTYVRVLCEQIAQKLSTYGYASYIRRVMVGEYSLSDAVSLGSDDDEIYDSLKEFWDVFNEMPRAIVTLEDEKELSHGREITIDSCDKDQVFLYNEEKELVAVAERKDNNKFGPKKVFI